MLTIRLTRKGKKNQPFFSVVLIDKRRSSKGGRTVEDLGYVDPLKKRRSFNKERIQYWISKGAQTSATMHNLLVSEKIIDAKKIHVSKLSKKAEAKIASASANASSDKESSSSASRDARAMEDKEKPASAESLGEAKPVEEEKPAEAEKSAEELPPAETPIEIEAPKEPASAESSGEAKEEKPAE